MDLFDGTKGKTRIGSFDSWETIPTSTSENREEDTSPCRSSSSQQANHHPDERTRIRAERNRGTCEGSKWTTARTWHRHHPRPRSILFHGFSRRWDAIPRLRNGRMRVTAAFFPAPFHTSARRSDWTAVLLSGSFHLGVGPRRIRPDPSNPGFNIRRLIGRVHRDPLAPLLVEDAKGIERDSSACDVRTRVEWARWLEHHCHTVARTSMDTHHTHHRRFTMDGPEEGRERSERYMEWKSGDEVHLHVLPETSQDGTLDYGELLRRRWTERGTGITKLVIPASLSLAEGLQTRFKFLVNLMEQVDARAMDDMEVIDLSMNSLMLNFLFNQMEHFQRLKILDVSGNYVHEEKQMEFLASAASCHVVNMSLLDMRRLPPRISISNLKVLMLDNNPLIEVIPQDCFANLVGLERLSMCATGISDLWTTVDGLSRLPALKHLRFQRGCGEGVKDFFRENERGVWDSDGHADVLWNRAMGGDHEWRQREANLLLSKYDMFPQHAAMFEKGHCQAGEEDVIYQRVFETFLARRQSPICLQRNYRQFLIARLPNLLDLDGLQVLPTERDQARINEDLLKGGVSQILTVREVAPSGIGHFRSCFQRRRKDPDDRQQCSQRFLQQAGRWPKVHEVCASREQPRQFEYHPTVPGIVAVGSADNHLIVQHHRHQTAIGKEEMSVSVGDHMWSSVLGICWFHKHPELLIAGSDNGTIRLFNVNVSGDPGSQSGILGRHRFEPFSDLTSISTNCMDDCFVVSGYSNDVALYDVCTHKVVNFFKNLHADHINVIKFSNLSPHLFATSSFDRDVKLWDLRTDMTKPVFKATSDAGNVTIGFSHNDQFLLSSATDNDVRQYLVSDGRLHTKLDLEPTGNCNNFTRSYYMRDAEYIISGSCEQPGARICSARNGKVMRQVTFENQDDLRMIVGVQSLRADPLEDLKFSVLTSSEEHYISSSRILEVDLTPCYSGG